MENKEAIEIFNKWMDCKDAYQADPSCDGNCLSCEYYTSAEGEKEAMLLAIVALEKQEKAYGEWCTDCKEYDHNRNCCPRYNRVIRGAVDEVKQQGWIPVSKKPKSGTDVLLQFEKNMAVGFYSCGDWNVNSGNGFYTGLTASEDQPIAWMPLPEPYQEDKA